MAGALNKLPIAVAGMIFFDAVVNVASISGVILAFSAGILYTIAKTRQAAELKKKQYLPVSESEAEK